MSRPFKKSLVAFAIAFPIAIALRILAPVMLPTVACVWQDSEGNAQRAKGKACEDAPENAVVLMVEEQ